MNKCVMWRLLFFGGIVALLSTHLCAQGVMSSNDALLTGSATSIDIAGGKLPFPDMPELYAGLEVELMPNSSRIGFVVNDIQSGKESECGFNLYGGKALNLSLDKGLSARSAKKVVKQWKKSGRVNFYKILDVLGDGELVNNFETRRGSLKKPYVKFDAFDNSRKGHRGIITLRQILKIKDKPGHYIQLEGQFESRDIGTIFYLANKMDELSILDLPMSDLMENFDMDRLGFGHASSGKVASYFFNDQLLKLSDGNSSHDFAGLLFDDALSKLMSYLEF